MSTIYAVHSFWFGEPDSPEFGQSRSSWYQKNPEFDAEIKERFWILMENAEAGQLKGWKSSPRGALALVLLFDQFSRNMFRDTPRAFATDPLALHIAKSAIHWGFDRCMLPVERQFLYMPLMHSETLEDQERSIKQFKKLQDDGLDGIYEYALKHAEIIIRFGRFPHRNALLRRKSTPEEEAFLLTPGSRF